jgi:hypothetical protein
LQGLKNWLLRLVHVGQQKQHQKKRQNLRAILTREGFVIEFVFE